MQEETGKDLEQSFWMTTSRIGIEFYSFYWLKIGLKAVMTIYFVWWKKLIVMNGTFSIAYFMQEDNK